MRKHELHSPWCLWYDKPRNVGQAQQLQTVAACEDWWAVHRLLTPPSQLSIGAAYHLFRKGDAPRWEEFPQGGRWIAALTAEAQLDAAWEELSLAAMGEQLADATAAVCGVSASVREGSLKLAVWVASCDEGAVMDTGIRFRDALLRLARAELECCFFAHADTMATRKAARANGVQPVVAPRHTLASTLEVGLSTGQGVASLGQGPPHDAVGSVGSRAEASKAGVTDESGE